jgi:hypothetical protein
MLLVKFRAITVLVAFLLCADLIAQTPAHDASTPTFHVKGAMRLDSYPLSAIPAPEVTLQGTHVVKTLTVDGQGFYEADLPLGFYTMTAEVPKIGPNHLSFFTKYIRQFRVTSPTTLILNGTLFNARMTCDMVFRDDMTEEQRREVGKDACGGEDSFPDPSKDGAPLQIYVRYPQRQPTDHGYVYTADSFGQTDAPVFLAYNLFSLEANKVIYDAKNRTIEASGNVVVDNASGMTRRADSMTFKIEDGQARLLK